MRDGQIKGTSFKAVASIETASHLQRRGPVHPWARSTAALRRRGDARGSAASHAEERASSPDDGRFDDESQRSGPRVCFRGGTAREANSLHPVWFGDPTAWRPLGHNSSHGDPIRLPPDGPNIEDDGRNAPIETPWQYGWDSRSCQGRERELKAGFVKSAPGPLTKPSLVIDETELRQPASSR
jgi:hypothetical protein